MSNCFDRTARAPRGQVPFESLEARVMMDASYQYSGQESFLKLPTDRLGGVGANANIVVLDDLNGDGVKEIAASGIASAKDQFGVTRNFGVVRLFDGKDGTLIRELTNTKDHSDTSFGNLMVLGEDQDSDGTRDLIVSDFNAVTNGGAGTIRVFSSRSGLQLTAFSVNNSNSSLGTFASVGDLDGDGEGDLVISGVFPTQVAGNPVLLRAYSARTGSLIWESAPASGTNYYDPQRVMSAIVPVGDLNGDGKGDLLVGGDDLDRAPGVLGAVFLLSGSNGSLLRAWKVGTITNVAGNRVAFLGDVNSDGIGDFAVVSYDRDTTTGTLAAKVSVYSLNDSNLSTPIWVKESIPWTKESGLSQIGFATVGDFNGDGVNDLGIMANPSLRQSTLQIRSGRNGVVLHEFTGTEVVSDWGRTTGNIFFGSSIAVGDLDGDGFNELLVGGQQGESPREGKATTNPFITIVPLMQFETPIVTRVNSAGIAFGTIRGQDFVTVDGVVTIAAKLRGALVTDRVSDANTLGVVIGSTGGLNAGDFILDSGVRTLLANLPQVDQLSTNAGFRPKPAGTYTQFKNSRLASNARGGLVEVWRENPGETAVQTTWLLRRNANDSGYELVYLFDGTPGGISADGRTFSVSGTEGVIDATSWFISERPVGLTGLVPSLFPVPGGVDITAVTAAGFVGVRRTDHKAVVGYFNSPLDGVDLQMADLDQVDGIDAAPISVDRNLDAFASITADGKTHAVLFAHNLVTGWTPIDLAGQDWLRGPSFHDGSESLTPLALSPFGRLYALHDADAFSLDQRVLVGSNEIDSARILADSPVGKSGTAIVGFNGFGELVYYRRESAGDAWSVVELPLPVGALVSGAVVWENGVALATDQGVLRLARNSAGSWETRNLTTSVTGATAITRSIRLVRENDGTLLIAGVNSENEVVFYDSKAANPDERTAWGFENLSHTVLTRFEIADPDLHGDLVTYVTPWNGLNIAGLNADGEPVVFWTAPGLDGWRFTNLADSQEDPTKARGFERLAVNVLPWGGIGLTDSDSSLRTVWWAPSLGGEWRFVALADAVVDSARPILVKESVVGYSTSWGGQNIAGVDAKGRLWVYWWSPQSGKWYADSLQIAVPAFKDRRFSPRVSAYASGGGTPMALTVVDMDQHVVHLSFAPATGWAATDATAEIERA